MAISSNILDRDKAAYKENELDGGLDRRVTDVSSQTQLNQINQIQGILSSNWLKLSVYDEMITNLSPDFSTLTVTFKEDGFILGDAIVNITSPFDWNFNLYRYLLDDDGSNLMDDDDTDLFLE